MSDKNKYVVNDPPPPPVQPPPMKIHQQLWAIKDTLIIILTPLILLPILFIYPNRSGQTYLEVSSKNPLGVPKNFTNPGGCAYTISLMIVYWMTEVLPMAVTALIPIVLFPWLGVQNSKNVCVNYLKDANMLFFGGLLVAIAVEKWNLHKRVALKVLILVGSRPLWIMFGFMMVTCFLSMWLNNTASTAMMMPIAQAVLQELDAGRIAEFENALSGGGQEMLPLDSKPAHPDDVQFKNGSKSSKGASNDLEAGENSPLSGGALSAARAESDRKFMAFRKALKVAVPFASSIGGCGTLIGCGPNIVMKGMVDDYYPDKNGISFTSWLVVGIPTMLLDIFGAWIILMLIFLGPKETFYCCDRNKKPAGANSIVINEYKKLGTISFAEIIVMINFLILCGLWFMRQPGFMPGWSALMGHKFVTDAAVAITISVLLFIFPSRAPNYLCFRGCSPDKDKPPKPSAPILDWPTVNKQMPWSVILLLGGGFALADACMRRYQGRLYNTRMSPPQLNDHSKRVLQRKRSKKQSGLSKDIGDQLVGFKALQPWLLTAMCALIAMIITSFTSNMATTTILIPIMYELSTKTQINPIYLMLPVTLAASYAFLLPVSTPPNAIAYSFGDLVISDMVKSGLAMCALCFSVLLFAINTIGAAFYDFHNYPEWAPPAPNDTILAP